MDLDYLRSNYRKDILELADKYKLEDIRIFGSVVRGEDGEDSDIDLLVHAKSNCSLLDISAFEVSVSELIGGKKVDVVDDLAIKPVLVPYILSEAIPL